MKKFLLHLIEQYRIRTAVAAHAGNRPDRLPCEKNGYCSQIFADILEAQGLPAAVQNMMQRCPKGNIHAISALTGSATLTLVPVGTFAQYRTHYRPYPGRNLSTPIDKFFGCG